jgi:hypothetical protein
MTEPAKDEAELLDAMVDAIWEYLTPETRWTAKPYVERDLRAAIRAAGWAVVPVALMEQAASALHEYIIHEHRLWITWEEKRRFDRDMELPEAIRAMLAAAPGVKP